MNLDTGVRNLGYMPDIDVRMSITVDEVMEEGYGPNGAIVESYERLMKHIEYYIFLLKASGRGCSKPPNQPSNRNSSHQRSRQKSSTS